MFETAQAEGSLPRLEKLLSRIKISVATAMHVELFQSGEGVLASLTHWG